MRILSSVFAAALMLGGISGCKESETAPPATVALSPADAIAYGAIWVGSSSDQTITLTNNGTAAATRMSGSFSSTNHRYKGGTFPGTGGTCLTSLGAGLQCTIVLTYAPAAFGVHADTFTLTYNYRRSTESVTKTLSGSGKTPGALSISVSDSNYGTVAGGTTSDKTFTVTNSGSESATSISSSVASPFSFPGGFPGAGDCGATLAGGASCTFTARYTPAACGAEAGSISLSYSTGVTSTSATQAVSGTGGCATLSISDGSTYDFGVQNFNSNTDKTFTVTNNGSAAASISAGGATSPFSFPGAAFPGGGDCGSTLTTSGSCTFVGRYTASACGSSSDAFSVTYSNGIATTSATRAVTGYGRCPGYLDIRFNTTGKTISTFSGNSGAFAVVFQTDGKLVVGGFKNGPDFVFARYLTQGGLDTSFDGDGILAVNGGGGFDQIISMAVQTDGKLVAAGPASTLAVLRLQTSGALDTAFNTSGVRSSVSGGGATLSGDSSGGLTLQTDGRIVIAANDGTVRWGVARVETNGTMDTSFYTAGVWSANLSGGAGETDYPQGGVVQSDGRLVTLGYYDDGAGAIFSAVLRHLTDGRLDTSYRTDGSSVYSLSANGDYMKAPRLDTDGRVVVPAGIGIGLGSTDFQIVRLVSDGTLDTSFATDGVAPSNATPAGATEGKALFIQTDGAIVAVGIASSDFVVAKFLSSGVLDTSFNTSGRKSTDVSGTDTPAAIAQWGDRFCVAGTSNSQVGIACYFQ